MTLIFKPKYLFLALAWCMMSTVGAQELDRSDVPVASPAKPFVLNGQIKTVQEAAVAERSVDWYAWYLACRRYLAASGGLQCAPGTPIRFSRDGTIEALSFSPVCRQSVARLRFALPPETRLPAVLLPVRSGSEPPATPEELLRRIED